MNFISKAILFKELKQSIWFVPIMIFILLIYSVNLYDNNNFDLAEPLGFIVTLICVIIMGLKTNMEISNVTFSFTASLPIKRETIIKTKWLVGITNILVSFCFTYLILILSYLNRIYIFDFLPVLTKWFILNTMLFSFIFTLSLLVGTNTSNSALGFIVTIFTLLFPYIFINIIALPLDKLLQTDTNLSAIVENLKYYLSLNNYFFIDIYSNVNKNTFGDFRYVVVLLLIFISFLLVLKSYNGLNFEKLGLFNSKRAKNIYSLIISCYILLIFDALISLFFNLPKFFPIFNWNLFFMLLIPLIPIYIITYKIINKFEKKAK